MISTLRAELSTWIEWASHRHAPLLERLLRSGCWTDFAEMSDPMRVGPAGTRKLVVLSVKSPPNGCRIDVGGLLSGDEDIHRAQAWGLS